MMEMRIRFEIDVPERGDGEQQRRIARQFLLKLAAELIRCSVEWEESDRVTTAGT